MANGEQSDWFHIDVERGVAPCVDAKVERSQITSGWDGGEEIDLMKVDVDERYSEWMKERE